MVPENPASTNESGNQSPIVIGCLIQEPNHVARVSKDQQVRMHPSNTSPDHASEELCQQGRGGARSVLLEGASTPDPASRGVAASMTIYNDGFHPAALGYDAKPVRMRDDVSVNRAMGWDLGNGNTVLPSDLAFQTDARLNSAVWRILVYPPDDSPCRTWLGSIEQL